MEKIEIKTEYIKLDQFLKWAGIAESGVDAKYIIADGLVRVNNKDCLMRGKKLYKGDNITVKLDKIYKFLVE
jgi:ribosome-associated protein